MASSSSSGAPSESVRKHRSRSMSRQYQYTIDTAQENGPYVILGQHVYLRSLIGTLSFCATTWENVPSDMCASVQSGRSSLSACRNLVSLIIQNALSEYSDQTVRMRRLIRIFAERTCLKVRLSDIVAHWLIYATVTTFFKWAKSR